MGTLFMVNPPKRKKRRTAAQKRATAKLVAGNKARKRGTKKRRRVAAPTTRRKSRTRNMATKRKRTTAKRRRRSSSAKRRSPVTSLRRHRVYLTNPRKRRRARPAAAKRRRRRGGYSRNPSIIASLKQGAMDAGATLVGGAAARIVSGFVPLPKDGLAGVATGLAVALGVGIAARKFTRGDTARFIVAGAMQVPIKSLITTFVPGAGAYLGDYDNISAYALPSTPGVGDYLNPGMYGQADDVEIGVYE